MNTYWILFIAIIVASWLVSALMEQRFKKFSKVYLPLTGKEGAEKMLRLLPQCLIQDFVLIVLIWKQMVSHL